MDQDEIVVKFSAAERDLIINDTFAGPDLTKRFETVEIDELEDLSGFIAAEAKKT